MAANFNAVLFRLKMPPLGLITVHQNGMMQSEKKEYSFFQKIKYSAVAVLGFLFLIIAIGEILLRIFAPLYGPSYRAMTDFFFSVKNDKLGWKIEPNYSKDFTYTDKAGISYEVSLKYDENSFKSFGNINSTSPKILFIGDSYTASVEVSNEKTFFNILKDSLGIEVFAIGAGGYGTLQEYLVLDEWIDKISPDVVVWQTCSNDFMDNTPEMERLSGYKVGERRPYLNVDDKIFYERPVSAWKDLEEISYFIKWWRVKWKALTAQLKGKKEHIAEYYISEKGLDYPPFARSVKITSDIIKKVRNRLPEKTKMLAFCADPYQPQMDTFKNIFTNHEFPFSELPALYCRNSDWNGKTPFARDGYHWNEYGHRLVASGLLPDIKSILLDLGYSL